MEDGCVECRGAGRRGEGREGGGGAVARVQYLLIHLLFTSSLHLCASLVCVWRERVATHTSGKLAVIRADSPHAEPWASWATQTSWYLHVQVQCMRWGWYQPLQDGGGRSYLSGVGYFAGPRWPEEWEGHEAGGEGEEGGEHGIGDSIPMALERDKRQVVRWPCQRVLRERMVTSHVISPRSHWPA